MYLLHTCSKVADVCVKRFKRKNIYVKELQFPCVIETLKSPNLQRSLLTAEVDLVQEDDVESKKKKIKRDLPRKLRDP